MRLQLTRVGLLVKLANHLYYIIMKNVKSKKANFYDFRL